MADTLHIQNPSITSGAFASMLAFSAGTDIITAISGHPIGGVGGGGGGTPAEGYWRPLYNDNTGDLSWLWFVESTANVPTPANIRGPQGEDGEQGPAGASGISLSADSVVDQYNKKTTVSIWQQGATAADTSFDLPFGQDGNSPTVITATVSDAEHPQGGVAVTISDATHPEGQTFDIWNGVDGIGSTINLSGSNGIKVEREAGTSNYEISISSDFVKPPANTAVQGWIWQTNSTALPGSTSGWYNLDSYLADFLYDYFAKIEGLNGISAGWVEDNDFEYFKIGIATSGIDADTYYTWTTSGWKALQIKVSADGRLCSIGEDNVFFYEAGGMNDVLLQGYANTGTYEDFAQGFENSAFQYSLVQGRQNKARTQSLAQGYHNIASGNSFAQGNENTAEIYSLAQGYENSAAHHSLAQGYENTASNYSFAQGTTNIALSYSLSQGVGNRAETYSIAQGQGNRAFANSQAFGLSTIASGSSIDGHHYGMMSIGSYNATSAGALFVIGNGYSQDAVAHRSDAFIVYKDGHVSAAGDIWANGVKLGSGGGGIVGPTGTGSEDKYWLYSTYTGNSWVEANSWLCNNFICENGISGVPDMSLGKVHIGLSGDYLPTSGGTVSGQLEVHGGSNFDQQFLKLTREGNSCGARIGLGSDTTNGTLALKTFNTQGQNTVQVNIKYNNNSELIQVQKDGNTVGNLIPAVVHQGSYTPSSDDGILHIVVEN